jgi:hypothetical protein
MFFSPRAAAVGIEWVHREFEHRERPWARDRLYSRGRLQLLDGPLRHSFRLRSFRRESLRLGSAASAASADAS